MSRAGVPSAALDAGIDLSNSYGGLALGCLLCTVFWSFLLVQTVYYQAHYAHDAWPLRLLAYMMFAIGTAFEVVYLNGLRYTLISHFGSQTQLVALVPSISSLPAVNACAALLAQSFFTHRIWKFAKHRAVKWLVPACLAPLIVMSFVASIWCTHEVLQLQTFAQLPPVQWELYLFIVPAVVTDIAIAVTLSLLFWRSRTGVKSTDRVLRALVISSLNSGAWPAAFATGGFILTVVLPNDLWYIALLYPTVQLYGNSVLGSLNARAALRIAGNAPSDTYALSTWVAHNGARGLGTSRAADNSDSRAPQPEDGDDCKAENGPRDIAVDLRRLPV